MRISERFVSAMRPLGKPLPIITSGQRDHHATYAGGVRMLGHAVDSAATALVRPLAGPVLGAIGAAKLAKAKPAANAFKTGGAAVKGLGSGALVGLAGGATALGEAVVLDAVGGLCLISLITCGYAVKGMSAGMHAVFGGAP